jgi:hypothetical protein
MDAAVTPRLTTPEEAVRTLRDYRKRHRIHVIPAPADDPNGGFVCAWDGIHVDTVVKHRWTHSKTDIGVLTERAPIPEVM